MKSLRPIEIIGGGLAGLSLGLALRRAGVSVTLYDAGTYPRHRVCGEFITGLTASTIASLGLEPFLRDALRHDEVAWFINGQPTSRQRLPAPALALSRHRLDARLADAFVDAGGLLHTNARVTGASAAAGCVLATGRRRRAKSDWLGLKIHVRHLPLHCDLELHLGNAAYVGLTQVEEGRVNVCGLFQRRDLQAKGAELLRTYLRASNLTVLADRLGGVDFDEASFSAIAAVSFDQHVRTGDGVTVGDACAVIPPFTGNGMAMAFQSAEVALEPLLAYVHDHSDWPETCQVIQTALKHRFRVRLATADLLHSFLLQPPRQRWLARLAQAYLLPVRPLYALLH
jgi:flavin-dependent dehydrogenase